MCIAIYKPKGENIKKKYLKSSCKNNSDGMGLTYVNKYGHLIIYKEMKSFEKFYGVYRSVVEMQGNPNMLIHFRIATAGGVNLLNCHPFKVNRNLAFIHNGILDIEIKNKVLSDTQTFNNEILKKLPKDFYKNDYFVDMLEDYVGTNKLIFIDSNSEVVIINEKLGDWHKGVWYSNSTYKYSYITKYTANGYNYSYVDVEEDAGFEEGDFDSYGNVTTSCSYCGYGLVSDKEIRDGICEECLDIVMLENANKSANDLLLEEIAKDEIAN